ncbi:signal transduction histidine kinase [Tamaricihabitans halophyticus]|uniref:histidine kinase n=1 Tax=Tamaricihabitans halophyticus TaxID=1262583 RepID=A0A4R2R1M4_9PSEU|nr:nitrate- and nitrite sensing domain-containing protein [Tamaricihabitans halophyticus]TCP56582.1 signal transduction histidine kinase [Tamaricihabitans halophyticus]
MIRRKGAADQSTGQGSRETVSPESGYLSSADSNETLAAGRSSDDAPQVGGRWRLRNWRLRTKLFVVLLIPLVAVLAFVGLRVQGDLAEAGRLSELDAQVQLETSAANAVHELQRERDLTVWFVSMPRSGGESELQQQRTKVDTAVTGFHGQREAADSELSETAANQFREVSARFDRLTALRSTVDSTSYPAEAIMRSYNQLVQGVHDTNDQLVAEAEQPEVSRYLLASNALALAAEQQSRKRALLLTALERESMLASELRSLYAADAEFDAAVSDFRKFATGQQQRMYDDTVMGSLIDISGGIEASAIAFAETDRPLRGGQLDTGIWDNSATYTLNRINEVHEGMQRMTQEYAESLVSQARESVIRDTAITGGVVLAAFLLALLVARSLLRPLRVLRNTALEIAEYRMPEEVEEILAAPEPARRAATAPEPVPVHSGEEVGQVARAFDAVHAEAVRQAAQQALLRDNVNAMFVNLSRRSQALVERQLGVLDRMESDEQDPDQLASLFELDHMATRMRRNSENLLVLAGSDLGRQVTEPIAVSEVIGAAVSEIEQYARIEVAPTPQRLIAGNAVNDVVHVISELLDNATAFSDPQTKVSVDTMSTRTGGLRLEISDRGVGMTDADIAATNDRLAHPPEVDVSVARRMGLYVVGRLAQRHQIRVRLRKNDNGGVTAGVLVPPELISDMVIETARPKAEQPKPEPQPAPPQPTVTGSAPLNGAAELGAVEPGAAPAEPVSGPPLPVRKPRTPGAPTGPATAPPPAGQPQDPAPPAPTGPVAPNPGTPPARQPVAPSSSDLFGAAQQNDDAPLSPLDEEAPTVRMPIYEAVLSQWFSSATTNGADSAPEEQSLTRNGDAATSQWHTPADAGWQAAEVLSGERSAPTHTAAGLPKRIPKERLVPGSATTQEPKPAMPRSAEATRGRMSSLQQGVRRGRHALQSDVAEPQHNGE